jgi:hypothetical protein
MLKSKRFLEVANDRRVKSLLTTVLVVSGLLVAPLSVYATDSCGENGIPCSTVIHTGEWTWGPVICPSMNADYQAAADCMADELNDAEPAIAASVCPQQSGSSCTTPAPELAPGSCQLTSSSVQSGTTNQQEGEEYLYELPDGSGTMPGMSVTGLVTVVHCAYGCVADTTPTPSASASETPTPSPSESASATASATPEASCTPAVPEFVYSN